MTPYGRKRTKTPIAGHQRCGICHPDAVSVAKERKPVDVAAVLADDAQLPDTNAEEACHGSECPICHYVSAPTGARKET